MTTAWTDERIERCKKLWADGLSARQVADELGGVSRNAVIGKLARLGVAGRGAAAPIARPLKSPRPPRPPRQPTKRRPSQGASLAIALAAAPEVEQLDRDIPLEQRRTLLTLRERDCRFPVGDPQQEDFFFCGAEASPGLPYCPRHARAAFNAGARPMPDARQDRAGRGRITLGTGIADFRARLARNIQARSCGVSLARMAGGGGSRAA